MKHMTCNDVYELAGTRAIIKIPYCKAQNILRPICKVGYNSGKYGWNYDVYDCGESIVVTGYRMRIKGIDADLRFLEILERRAKNRTSYQIADSLDDIDSLVYNSR